METESQTGRVKERSRERRNEKWRIGEGKEQRSGVQQGGRRVKIRLGRN